MPERRFLTTTADGNLAAHVGDDPTAVERNRLRLARSIGVERSQLRFMNQVHGNTIVVATSHHDHIAEADGLVTQEVGLALVVLTADCIPVLLSAPGMVAAVHVGRKGLVNGVARRAVLQMRQMGATTISAFFGPAICGSCYEVPESMQRDVCAVSPSARSVSSSGRPSLDIRAGLKADLEEMDVSSELDPRCTKESGDFYSFRRDRECGRFATVIMLS